MREISATAWISTRFAAYLAAAVAVAMLAGCAGEAPLATGAEAAASAPPPSAAESAENAALVANAAEVPVIAGGPRLVCRREIPIGSRIGQTVCSMEGGPRTAADELQDIQTDFELEQNRLDQLINMGLDDDASGQQSGNSGGQ